MQKNNNHQLHISQCLNLFSIQLIASWHLIHLKTNSFQILLSF